MTRLLLLCSLVLANPAFGADYWPMMPGATFHYTNGGTCRDVELATPHDGDGIVRANTIYTSEGQTWISTQHDTDPGGDVVMSYLGVGCTWCCFDDWTWGPPFVLLDYPLDIGKTWTTEAIVTSLWGTPFSEQVNVEVVEETTVAVPAGTFDVIKVSVESSVFSTTYWLHRDLGPVRIDPGGYELVYWTGIVPNEARSWGDVKALYR